jgi:hypothetical protein
MIPAFLFGCESLDFNVQFISVIDPTATLFSFPTATNNAQISKSPSTTKTPDITPFPMPAASVWVKPVEESATIRSGPGTNSKAIGILSDGEIASVIGKTWNADWLQISVGNLPGWSSGWVYSQAVKIDGDLGTITCVSTESILCETDIPPENFKTEAAIENIRFVTQNPNLPLTFSHKSQSPNAYLRDATVFVDDQGVEYYVDVATNQVIEFTQTQVPLLSNKESLDIIQLREIAEGIAAENSAKFTGIKESLVFTEGSKDDRYFFRWEKQNFTGKFLPLLQIGLDQSGTIVSYLNTLDILD